MNRDTDPKPAAPAKSGELIHLDDLMPRKNVQGGKGKPQVVFGSLQNNTRRNRPSTDL